MSLETRAGKQYTIEHDPAGYLHLRFSSGAVITMADMAEIVDAMAEMSGDRQWPLMVHMEELKSVDREARDYAARRAVVSAVAIVTRSPVGRAIGNFYMLVSNPKVSTKMFVSEEDAAAWLDGDGS